MTHGSSKYPSLQADIVLASVRLSLNDITGCWHVLFLENDRKMVREKRERGRKREREKERLNLCFSNDNLHKLHSSGRTMELFETMFCFIPDGY